MKKIVLKFGGTSVKTAKAIEQVAKIVTKGANVIVVSAVGGVTNMLVEFCQNSSQRQKEIQEQLRTIHLQIAEELKLSDTVKSEISNIINNLNTSDRPTLAECDAVLASGEQISSLLLHALLRKNNHEAVLLDARELIITDSHFGKANPNLERIKQRCAEKIPASNVAITQGFIGATESGITTTLGRGGSDFTAALLAEAIQADELYIYTDVCGVYTMDPNVIPDARLIKRMSFQEMAELANFGAKILHPATIAPCIRAKIPVVIASTFEPDKDHTYITANSDSANASPYVRAVTMRKHQTLITIRSLSMLNAYGFLARIFSILAGHHVSVDLITTSEVSVALTIDGTNIGSHGVNPITNQNLMNELHEVAEVMIEENLTLVAVVGVGLTTPGVAQKILSNLVDPIRLVCYGASSSSVGVLMQNKDALNAAKTLHKEFISTTENLVCP